MITLLLITPLLAIGIILSKSIIKVNTETDIYYKDIALIFSIINLVLSLLLWSNFNQNTTQGQYITEYNELSFCHLTLAVDGISIYFILLTLVLFPIIFLADYKTIKHNVKTYQIIMLLLQTLLIAVFTVQDILLFYIFFESILPPLFILIGL